MLTGGLPERSGPHGPMAGPASPATTEGVGTAAV